MTLATPRVPPLDALPGHYIRRLQQIAVAIFLEETETFGITPVQYAALSAVHQQPEIDQRTLGRQIGFDTSTIGEVVDRLERRGLLRRSVSPTDRRLRLLGTTPAGEALLRQVVPGMLRAQQRMLEPLDAADRQRFLEMLKTVVETNNASSRAPRDAQWSRTTPA